MLTKMITTLDFVMDHKRKIADKNIIDMIELAAAHNIVSDYALLIPNKKNITDARNLLNIDGAEVIMEFDSSPNEFGVHTIISANDTTEDVINFFKQKSIIVSNNEKMDEYIEFARIAEELSYSKQAQYFNIRNNEFLSWRNISAYKREIDNFWIKQTRDNILRISSIDFNSNVSVQLHGRLPLPQNLNVGTYRPAQQILNQIAYNLSAQIRVSPLVKGYKSMVRHCTIYVPESARDVFGLGQNHGLSKYNDNKHIDVTRTKKEQGFVEWEFSIAIPYFEFMKRVADYYYNSYVD